MLDVLKEPDPRLHHSSIPRLVQYVGARRLSATKQMGFFNGLAKGECVWLSMDFVLHTWPSVRPI